MATNLSPRWTASTPRDWFDYLLLRQNEGLITDIRQTFAAYIAAHNRPINEILTPNPQPLEAT